MGKNGGESNGEKEFKVEGRLTVAEWTNEGKQIRKKRKKGGRNAKSKGRRSRSTKGTKGGKAELSDKKKKDKVTKNKERQSLSHSISTAMHSIVCCRDDGQQNFESCRKPTSSFLKYQTTRDGCCSDSSGVLIGGTSV